MVFVWFSEVRILVPCLRQDIDWCHVTTTPNKFPGINSKIPRNLSQSPGTEKVHV